MYSPFIPARKPMAAEGYPNWASMAEILMPFPPGEDVLDVARSHPPGRNSGIMYSSSTAGLRVTVNIMTCSSPVGGVPGERGRPGNLDYFRNSSTSAMDVRGLILAVLPEFSSTMAGRDGIFSFSTILALR
jgi:hypothetical protein